MAKWGDTDFKIQWGTFVPPHTDDSLNVINILADHDDLTGPAQVKQQSGRRLQQTSFVVVQWPPNLTFHTALENDKNNGTVRTFEGPLGVEMSCMVQTVGQVNYQGSAEVEGAMFFNVTLIEAEEISP